MALTTKSGALWQMSRAEKDEGWTDEGHAFVGREVVRSTSATAQSVGTIYCWLPPTVEDCYEDEDGKPAPLFKVRFLVGELDGDVEDLDIRQVVESLVTESVLRPPPRRIHRRQTLARVPHHRPRVPSTKRRPHHADGLHEVADRPRCCRQALQRGVELKSVDVGGAPQGQVASMAADGYEFVDDGVSARAVVSKKRKTRSKSG